MLKIRGILAISVMLGGLCIACCGKEPVVLPGFREVALPVSTDLRAVWFADSLQGVICGGKAWQEGVILSTFDGGTQWRVDTVLARRMEHVSFDPAGRAFVCGQDQWWMRAPGAGHWQLLREDYQWLRCAHFPTPWRGALVSGEGFHSGQLRVFGPGAFWQQDTLHEVAGELDAVWYPDSNSIVAAGAGWVIRSADAGRSWVRLQVTGDVFTGLHFPDAHTGFMCGQSGTLLKSIDGGASWTVLRRGGAAGARRQPFQALWFKDADTGWVVGDRGVFWQTDDGGAHWRPVADVPGDADFTDVFVVGRKGWATAAGGRLFEWTLE